MSSAVIPLDQASGHPGAGGKARGLAALIAAGFPVPEGFVALPEASAKEVVAAWQRLGAPAVAVRSSAVEEDSTRLSYAGQFDTFLNVASEEELTRALDACRGSGARERVLSYRLAVGESETGGAVAVIVQRMLRPDFAGVAFVPAGGEAIVEGVAGLGDALVSGRAPPVALPDELRREVGRLAQEVAARLGAAQDIEWAADEGGRVWLLQARPLTAPVPATLPLKLRLWTGANTQEAIPRPLTPFSEEMVMRFIESIFSMSYRVFGLAGPDGPSVRLFRGRVYMSYSAMATVLSGMPGFKAENLFRNYGDGPELAPLLEYTPRPKLQFLLRAPATLARLLPRAIFVERHMRRLSESFREMNVRLENMLGRDAGNRELFDFGNELEDRERPSIETFTVCAAPAIGLLGALMEWGARLAPGVPSAAVAALANAGEMQSLEPARQLAALGRWLREHPDLPDDHAEVQKRLTRFLEACGSRCEGEAELAQPRWRERPAEVLRLARQLSSDQPPVGRTGLTPVPAWLRLALWPLARAARKWQQRREAIKAAFAEMAFTTRRFLLEVGRRNQAVLAAPEDVFYLLPGEVEKVLSGPHFSDDTSDFPARIAWRKQRHHFLLELPSPPRLLAELPGGALVPFEPEPVAGAGDTLRGFGASPGRARGRARVLAAPDDSGSLQPGEVLVARTTDIGWTPLFRLASAVVTEIGAPTSHAAIVARELGVPAVVNVARATERIRTGDELLVDGWSGDVQISH